MTGSAAEAARGREGSGRGSQERTAKGKAICELRSQGRYIDACRVVQGLEPIHGAPLPSVWGRCVSVVGGGSYGEQLVLSANRQAGCR